MNVLKFQQELVRRFGEMAEIELRRTTEDVIALAVAAAKRIKEPKRIEDLTGELFGYQEGAPQPWTIPAEFKVAAIPHIPGLAAALLSYFPSEQSLKDAAYAQPRSRSAYLEEAWFKRDQFEDLLLARKVNSKDYCTRVDGETRLDPVKTTPSQRVAELANSAALDASANHLSQIDPVKAHLRQMHIWALTWFMTQLPIAANNPDDLAASPFAQARDECSGVHDENCSDGVC